MTRRAWSGTAPSIRHTTGDRPRACDVEDVLAAVDFACGQGLSVAVRSGGHSDAGFGTCDSGVLIDLSRIKRIDVDPVSRRARIEPGLTWAEVAAAAHAHGLALTSGNSGSVGVGGLLLGGGMGWMARKYGLTIDRLRAVELVTASGRFVRASATEHAELFWASAVEVETSVSPRHSRWTCILGGTGARRHARLRCCAGGERAASLWSVTRRQHRMSSRLTALLRWLHRPHSFRRSGTVGRLSPSCCASGDVSEGEHVVAPLRLLAEPIADAVAPMPYPALFQLTAQQTAQRQRINSRNYFLRTPEPRGLDALARLVPTLVSAESVVELKVAGGAAGRARVSATAYAHRATPVWVACLSGGPDAAGDNQRQDLLQRFESVMRPHAAGSYVNAMGFDEAERSLDAYPPATYARLVALKRRYDPTNLFRHNQNITPD